MTARVTIVAAIGALATACAPAPDAEPLPHDPVDAVLAALGRMPDESGRGYSATKLALAHVQDVQATLVKARGGAVFTRTDQDEVRLRVTVLAGRWVRGTGRLAGRQVLELDALPQSSSTRLPRDAGEAAWTEAAWWTSHDALDDARDSVADWQTYRRKQSTGEWIRPGTEDRWTEPLFHQTASPRVRTAERAAPPDADLLAERARTLSESLGTDPRIGWSEVVGTALTTHRTLLARAKLRLEEPLAEVRIEATAQILDGDGHTCQDQAIWLTRSWEDQPALTEQQAALVGLEARLMAWTHAPWAEQAYTGPVVLEDEAALVLLGTALPAALAGRQRDPVPPAYSSGEAWPPPVALGESLLPPGWQLTDDPTRDPALASSFRTDLEGWPAAPQQLITDGVVTHRYGTGTGTDADCCFAGHARVSTHREITLGLPSWSVLTAPEALSTLDLYETALETAADQGLDHVLVIRSLGLSWNQGLVDAAFLFADGHEEPVRGLRFDADHAAALLAHVQAGGPVRTATRGHLYAHPTRGSWSEEPASVLPITWTVPDLLLAPVTLVPVDRSETLLPPP